MISRTGLSIKAYGCARRLAGLAAAMLAVVFAVLGGGTASAQANPEWRVILGGEGDDFAHAVALAADGGYVIAGETRTFGAGAKDGWLVKLDAQGSEVWSRTYGGAYNDIIFDVHGTADGGFVLAGETGSAGGAASPDSNFWLIKVDSEGYEEWQRNYGNSRGASAAPGLTTDSARAVRQTSDGGYVLVGRSAAVTGSSIRVLKTDSAGAVQWDRDLSDSSGGVAYDVAETSSGSLVIAGNSSTDETGSDALLIRLDSGGNTIWSRTYGGSYNDEARSLAATGDGGFALGGFTWSYGAGLSDFWLLKTDSQGELQWQRSYGGVFRDAAHSLVRTEDGGFVLAGWSESFSQGDRFWVVKTDPSGQMQWSGAYPGASRPAGSGTVSAGARAIVQAEDGGFVVAGWTGDIRGVRDIMVAKAAPIESGPPAQSGAAVVLENTGAINITAAAVGFDSVFFGNPLRFWYNGMLIDQDNPLPGGEIACTQPAPALVAGSSLTMDQIGSYEFVYLDSLVESGEADAIDIDGEGFQYNLDGLRANLKIVSDSPCEAGRRQLPEGPRAPLGLSGAASDTRPGSVTLEWADNPEPDIFGYSVYLSRARTGPFVRRAWLLSDSSYADPATTDGASYYYAVAAINSWGLESPKSSVVRVGTTDFTPPAPPTGVTLTGSDRIAGTAQLEWTASQDADLSGYRVYRQDGDGPRAPVTALLSGTGFKDLTLPPEGIFSYSVTAIDLSGNESDWSNIAPAQLDFFGAVLQIRRNFIDEGTLGVMTARGLVDMAVVSDTEISVPGRAVSGLGDLAVGDHVAVSLKENASGTVARQVYLVPARTRNRHFVGTISGLTADSIEIQPPDGNSPMVSFSLSESVGIKFHQGGVELGVGDFVVASYLSTDEQGEPSLTEINVIAGPEPESVSGPIADPANVALVRGIFQGINPENANIILSSTEVGLDANTEMTAGMSVGDAVLVEAELLADGSLLARKIEHDEGMGRVAVRTIMLGIFQGRDAETGLWTVSSTQLEVDRHTYTDGLPNPGQPVKVSAIVRDDGTLYAREIENLRESATPGMVHTVFIEGIFREISAQGEWNVGGVPIRVDVNTVLSGRPSVGRRVAVTATGGRGDLLATEVSAIATEQDRLVRAVSIRGTLDRWLDGQWMVVDGAPVLLSDLTKILGEVSVGSTVRVRAELQGNGDLLAREVALSAAYDETRETQANPVDIEGRIELVEADGSLVVNGIPVSTTALTSIDASLQVGSPVQVRGILQRDGSVLAREIVGYGPSITGGTEASVSGVVESVETRADGTVAGFVVHGVSVAVDALTRVEMELIPGVAVVVQAVVVNGDILAVTVEQRPAGSVGVLPTVQMQGTVALPFASPSPFPVDIVVNGITVRVTRDTEIVGAISGGTVVKVSGAISGGIFVARRIESVRSLETAAEERVHRFILRGAVEEIRRDDEGRVESILLAGNQITIVPLTIFQDEVAAGSTIIAQGIVRDGVLFAASIKLQ